MDESCKNTSLKAAEPADTDRVSLTEGIFLLRSSEIPGEKFLKSGNFRANHFYQVDSEFYVVGKAKFFLDIDKKCYVGLAIPSNEKEKYDQIPLELLFQGNPFDNDEVGVIVNTKYIKDVQHDSNCQIDSNCIYSKNDYCSLDFPKGSLFQFKDELKYGMVKETSLINGEPFIGFVESIPINHEAPIGYISEDKVSKVDIMENTFDKESVVSPLSVYLLETENVSNISMGDRVSFSLAQYDTVYIGQVIWMALVNLRLEIAAVALNLCESDRLNEFIVNGLPQFTFLYQSTNMKVVLVKSHVLQPFTSVFAHCSKNNVKIYLPHRIESCEKSWNGRKQCFRENDAIIVLWLGNINKQSCVGLELPYHSRFGTDGSFNGERLFDCIPGRGVLVLWSDLNISCLKSNHYKPKYDNCRIDLYSICCAESIATFKSNPDLKLGSPVCVFLKNCKVFGTCRWLGRMSGKEIVGLEMTRRLPFRDDNQLISQYFFICDGGQGIFVDRDRCKITAIGVKYCEMNQLYLANPFDIRSIGNGQTINKTVFYKCCNVIKPLELKWKGRINGVVCLGCKAPYLTEYGTNGTFGGNTLFTDTGNDEHRYVLVLSDMFPTDCVNGHHQNLKLIKRCVNTNTICCFETVGRFQSHPQLVIGCKVFIIDNRNGDGVCKWIGKLNGQDVVGIELNHDIQLKTSEKFNDIQLFQCKPQRGVFCPIDSVKIRTENGYGKSNEHSTHRSPVSNQTSLERPKELDQDKEKCHFTSMPIPIDQKPFPEIDLNSSVIYYKAVNDSVQTLYGTVKWSGKNRNDQYFYGLELDNSIPSGTTGTFKNETLFSCRNGCGVLVAVNNVAIDSKFCEDDNGYEIKSAIPVGIFEGDNFGIQGNSNSCYFDSALFVLFSKTDVLDYLISTKNNEIETSEITKEFRNILAWHIVYPLRRIGFVSFHRTEEMRNVIRKYGLKFEEMLRKESDMENISNFLSKLCQNEQLIKMISYTSRETDQMFVQLSVILPSPREILTSEEILHLSMVQNEVVFKNAPGCLIFQAPRDARENRCYRYIIPSNTIEISSLCKDSFRQCRNMDCCSPASFVCRTCLERNDNDIFSIYSCENHKCVKHESSRLPDSNVLSKSKVYLKLKGIICISKCHFVAYVQQDESSKQWFFFDSMSSVKVNSNYSVPKVSYDKRVSDFLNLSINIQRETFERYAELGLKEILADSYVFVYHNPCQTCY